jgi:hypothetical protein
MYIRKQGEEKDVCVFFCFIVFSLSDRMSEQET